MLGEASRKVVPESGTAVWSVVSDPVYQVALVFLLLCLAAGAGEMRGLLRNGESKTGGSPSSGGMLSASLLAGIVLVACTAVRWSGVWFPSERMGLSGSMTTLGSMGMALAAAGACAAWQWTTIQAAGLLSRNYDFSESLLRMKRVWFSVSAVVVAPLFLLSSLSEWHGWPWVLGAVCCIPVLLFMKQTLGLFMDKKIPIFHWILYLCTVEAFPLTLAVALTARFR